MVSGERHFLALMLPNGDITKGFENWNTDLNKIEKTSIYKKKEIGPLLTA